MQEDQGYGANQLQRTQSSRLLRQGSAILGGGVALIPPEQEDSDGPAEPGDEAAGERLPLRRPGRRTQRQTNRSQVQERLMREVWRRFCCPIVCVVSVFLASFLATVSLLLAAGYYSFLDWHDPKCDKQLKWYPVVFLAVSFLNNRVLSRCCCSLCCAQLLGFTIWVMVIDWGLTMVHTAKTCPETNPELYYSTKYLIYSQIIFVAVATVFFGLGVASALLFFSTLEERMQPGCVPAVQRMDRVKAGSDELIDPDDGHVMECPICCLHFDTEGFPILRTPCGHFFHEACLVKWCSNHVDCPLCRSELGDDEKV